MNFQNEFTCLCALRGATTCENNSVVSDSLVFPFAASKKEVALVTGLLNPGSVFVVLSLRLHAVFQKDP